MEKFYIKMYLDYVNNFLTVEKFAEYHSMTLDLANWIINNGRCLNHYQK